MYNVKLTCGSIQSRSRWGFIKSTNVSSKFLKRPCWEKVHVHTLINTNDTAPVLTSYKTDSNGLLIRCVDPFLTFPATVWTRAIKVFCDWLIRAPIFPATFGRANCLIISKPAQSQKWAFGLSKPLWVTWRNYWWLAGLSYDVRMHGSVDFRSNSSVKLDYQPLIRRIMKMTAIELSLSVPALIRILQLVNFLTSLASVAQ